MGNEITETSVNEKLGKGEALTKEETSFVMSMPPKDASGNKPPDEEEEIDWSKAENVDAGAKKKDEGAASTAAAEGETPEEKKVREDKEATEAKAEELKGRAKKAGLEEGATEEDVVAAEKKTAAGDTTIDMAKLERELGKPANEANLNDFTSREKAYFHQMQRDRSARQKAEADLDAAKFRELKAKNTKKEEGAAEEEEDPLKELKAEDPEDFMTAAEVLKTVEGILKKKAAPAAAKEEPGKGSANPVMANYLTMCDKETRIAHPDDYDAVMELTDELINSNDQHMAAIVQAIAKGENPAETSYQLIKADPEFLKLYPAAELRFKARKDAKKKPDTSKTPDELKKEKDAQAAQDLLEKNKGKIKTTGHAGGEGGGDKGTDIDGYTIEDIINMSDLTFAKLPKKTRVKFLEEYG